VWDENGFHLAKDTRQPKGTISASQARLLPSRTHIAQPTDLCLAINAVERCRQIPSDEQDKLTSAKSVEHVIRVA